MTRAPWWEGVEVEPCTHDEYICSMGALVCCRACDHDGYLTALTRAAIGTERERPIRERLAEEVREGLEAKGWNQADLAFATNTSEKHISQVLNGNADASVQWWQDTLDALAARTGGTDV